MTFFYYLEAHLVVRRRFFRVLCLFGEAFLDFSEKTIAVVALCTSHTHSRHFASQLNISTTSGLPRSWRSACAATWVTCHANMSVCVAMALPGVYSHFGASGGESLQNTWSRRSTSMTNHQGLYDASTSPLILYDGNRGATS